MYASPCVKLPLAQLPAGDVLGLPVGLSFYAGPYSEAKLIGYAYAFEQATHARLTPQFRATVPASSLGRLRHD